MAEQSIEDHTKSRKQDKRINEETSFDLNKCSEALRESFNEDYRNKFQSEKSDISENGQDTAPDDVNEDDGDDDEKTPRVAEFDDEHLKELHVNMSDEQLEELKIKSNDLKSQGNVQYKNGCFLEAVDLYTEALNCCPLQFSSERSILYGNRSAAYIGLDDKKKAVEDCNKALELNPNYMRALLRRAQLHRKMDSLDQCLEDYKKILESDPSNSEARQACAVLPGEINERNEKLKTEMLGKLKDLGNVVLRPFGLSTENFKMVQDPNTGGYSINFQNNPKS